MKRKVLLITGATDGLGKALAIEASHQYDLALCGRSEEKMKALLPLLDASAKLVSECFDLTDETKRSAFCKKVEETFPFVDVVINNAGANLKKETVAEMDLTRFQQMMDLNCIAPTSLIQTFYPKMKEKQEGMFVNILSSCCLYHNKTMAGYTASKDAFDAVSKILLKEAKEDHIKVLCVYPGGIDTNFRPVPNHTYLKPESVAHMILQAIENDDGAVQELVMRPLVEDNIA